MKIMLGADNLLSSSNLSSAATIGLPGFPPANLTDADELGRPFIGRQPFVIVAGSNDKAAFNDGSARTGTLNAGTYYGAAGINELTRAMNAAGGGTDFAGHRNNATNVHKLTKGSGSFSIDPTAADSALPTFGFIAAQASATSQTAELASLHHPAVTGLYGGERIQWDLTEAMAVDTLLVIAPYLSPAALCYWHAGSTAAGNSLEVQHHDFDTLCLPRFLTAAELYRYWTLHLVDPYATEPAGACYAWAGRAWEPERGGWEVGGYQRSVINDVQSIPAEVRTAAHLSARSVVERLDVPLFLPPEERPTAEDFVERAGLTGLVVLAAMPDDEPTEETVVGYLLGVPTLTPVVAGDRRGWLRLSLSLAVVQEVERWQ